MNVIILGINIVLNIILLLISLDLLPKQSFNTDILYSVPYFPKFKHIKEILANQNPMAQLGLDEVPVDNIGMLKKFYQHKIKDSKPMSKLFSSKCTS